MENMWPDAQSSRDVLRLLYSVFLDNQDILPTTEFQSMYINHVNRCISKHTPTLLD